MMMLDWEVCYIPQAIGIDCREIIRMFIKRNRLRNSRKYFLKMTDACFKCLQCLNILKVTDVMAKKRFAAFCQAECIFQLAPAGQNGKAAG